MAMITQNLDYVLSVGNVRLIPCFLTLVKNRFLQIKTCFGWQEVRPIAKSKARSEIIV